MEMASAPACHRIWMNTCRSPSVTTRIFELLSRGNDPEVVSLFAASGFAMVSMIPGPVTGIVPVAISS